MKTLRSLIAYSCLFAGLVVPQALLANPKGGQVKAGSASFESGPNSLTIRQTSDRGIIHWENFSIGAGETTRFIQPGSNSATLNRVVGGNPSAIYGNLEANGKVYLINPNGILVGPSGRINTAAFVASTLDVPDAEFLAGSNMHFKGDSLAGVVNLGTITATSGDVVLMGHTVRNAGTINARNGVAVLAAGNDILLQATGDERVVVNSGIATGGTGVTNSGTMRAAQAELKAAGGNVYALAVNNTGIVRATGITQRNGRVILGANSGVVQNTGTLSAKNFDRSGGHVRMASGKGGHTIQNGIIDASGTAAHQNGGTVELLGDNVTVGPLSLIDVSGANAGVAAIGVDATTASKATSENGIGKVLGDNSQTDPTQLTTAQKTEIQAGSRILANATSAGQGGHVVVWSEQQSVVGGTIEAKGGESGGDGGLVETSGRLGLTITPGTVVNTAAPKGKAGNWLLDPVGITVDNNPSNTVNGSSSPFTQSGSTNDVKAGDIVTALGSGNVIVQTTGFPSNADIVVNSAISIPTALGSAHTLTLDSAGGITLNAPVGGAASDVMLQMTARGGSVAVSAGATVQMNGISAHASGSVSIGDQLTALNNQNIQLTADTGIMQFFGSGKAVASSTGTVYLDTHTSLAPPIKSLSGVAVSAGSLDIWSGAQGVGTSASPFLTAVDNLDVIVNNNAPTGGAVFVSNSSGGTLHIGGVTPLSGWPASGGVLVPSIPGFLGVEIKNAAGNIRLDSTTNERITAQGDIKLTTTGSGDIQILNPGVHSIFSHAGGLTLTAAGNVLIGDAGSNVWGINVRGQTDVIVQAGGDVTVAGSLLKAGGGVSGLSVTAGGDIKVLTSNGNPAIMGTSGGAPITLTTGAGKTFNDNTTSSGGVKATLTDDLTGVASTGVDIVIKADNVVINAPIVTGANNVVVFEPVTNSRPMEIIGSLPKTAGSLSFTTTELAQISAGSLSIGGFTSTGDLDVSGPSTYTPGFGAIDLATSGNMVLNMPISMPSGTLTLEGDGSTGVIMNYPIVANQLNVLSSNGAADAAGGIITANYLTFNVKGTAHFVQPKNSIGSINTVSVGVSSAFGIDLTTAGNLQIIGRMGTSGTTLFVHLITGGSLIFNTGGNIDANNIDLDISHGTLNNSSALPGDGALVVTGRYRVWLANYFSAIIKGGLTGVDYVPPAFPTATAVAYNTDPLGAGNVFYYANITPPTPPPPPTPAQTVAKLQSQATSNPSLLSDPTFVQQLNFAEAQVAYTDSYQKYQQQETARQAELANLSADLAKDELTLRSSQDYLADMEGALAKDLDRRNKIMADANQKLLELFLSQGIELPINQEVDYVLSHIDTLKAALVKTLKSEGNPDPEDAASMMMGSALVTAEDATDERDRKRPAGSVLYWDEINAVSYAKYVAADQAKIADDKARIAALQAQSSPPQPPSQTQSIVHVVTTPTTPSGSTDLRWKGAGPFGPDGFPIAR